MKSLRELGQLEQHNRIGEFAQLCRLIMLGKGIPSNAVNESSGRISPRVAEILKAVVPPGGVFGAGPGQLRLETLDLRVPRRVLLTRLGKLLVSSRTSRALYGVGKALAFCLMILLFTPGMRALFGGALQTVAYASVYATLLFCLIRGTPVLVEARRLV